MTMWFLIVFSFDLGKKELTIYHQGLYQKKSDCVRSAKEYSVPQDYCVEVKSNESKMRGEHSR